MTTDLDSIKKTLIGISRGENVLDTLLEFERTLDNAELFSYKNWINGELVDGPHIGRYVYSCTFMYPYNLMPDPNGGLRLTKLGAKVNFKEGTFKKPVKVTGPKDWASPSTKRAKMVEHDVWLVTIELPIKYIDRGLEQTDAIIQKDIDQHNSELEDAFTVESDNEINSDDLTGNNDGDNFGTEPGEEV